MHTRHLVVLGGFRHIVLGGFVCSVGGSSVVELLFDYYVVAVGSHLIAINCCCGR